MTRVKRSLHARKKRRETLEMAKGYRGDASRHYRTAKEALLKAETYAYRDRRNRKRDFRRLWITRINAAARQNGMSYSQFIHGLQLAGVELDRKVLADIAVRDPETFRRFAETAREAAAAGARSPAPRMPSPRGRSCWGRAVRIRPLPKRCARAWGRSSRGRRHVRRSETSPAPASRSAPAARPTGRPTRRSSSASDR